VHEYLNGLINILYQGKKLKHKPNIKGKNQILSVLNRSKRKSTHNYKLLTFLICVDTLPKK
jgi:hypothetical protein